MKPLSRFLILASFFLVSATAVPAQARFISSGIFHPAIPVAIPGMAVTVITATVGAATLADRASVALACIIPRSTRRSE